MRVSQKEMEENHSRILDGAARLIRERGVEGTSVADAMHSAGLTQGGFYRHFRSKDKLLTEALRSAFEQFISGLEAQAKSGDPKSAAAGFIEKYLSRGHVKNPGLGCPVTALGGEVARAPDELKAEFGKGVERVIGLLAKGKKSSAEEDLDQATREFAMMAGAVIIARASDAATADKVLNACRHVLAQQ